MAEARILYKGKQTNRSWSELPAEIVRMIASDCLWAVGNTSYTPEQWEARLFWYNRVVYSAVRDVKTMELLMHVCPQWKAALELHPFWNHLGHALDPQEMVIRRNPQLLQQTPYHISSTISFHSCLICRINYPQNSKGVGMADRQILTRHLGHIPICREHRAVQRTGFCGLCLREGHPYEIEMGIDASVAVYCMANEDDVSFPGIDATCRACRSEWLWRTACHDKDPSARDAVGGRALKVSDWEARTMIDSFLELGDGTISDILTVCKERHWLRRHTRIQDMMSQALAATRFNGGETEEELEMEMGSELEDEEDEVEMMQIAAEEHGVKELAMGDWARHRILDGHWLSPADCYYGQPSYHVKAVHPCPWSIETTGDEDLEHPSQAVYNARVPPSSGLREMAGLAYRVQLRLILMPAMKNIVRKIIIECSSNGLDPTRLASRMSPEDVMRELREEVIWFNGVDWLERRRNARCDDHAGEVGSDDHSSTESSSGKSSDGSSITSPVLSTSTFQTTPSPPPGKESVKEDEARRSLTRLPVIAVDPVLDPPAIIHPIPYVPLTAEHLPPHSMDCFKQIWREACSSLYHCRCSICLRAQAKQAGENAGNANTTTPSDVPIPGRDAKVAPPIQIQLREVQQLDAEGEPEVPFEQSDEPDFDDDDEDLSDFSDLSDGNENQVRHGETRHYTFKPNRVSRSRSRSPSLPPTRRQAALLLKPRYNQFRTPSPAAKGDEPDRPNPPPSRPRKRSCEEVDENGPLTQYLRGEPGTPPKRARRDLPNSTLPPPIPSPPFSMRISPKKRGSEELDDFDSSSKRVRVALDEEDSGSGDSPPRSTTAAAEESDDVDESVVSVGRRGIKADSDTIPRSVVGDKDGAATLAPDTTTTMDKRSILTLSGRG